MKDVSAMENEQIDQIAKKYWRDANVRTITEAILIKIAREAYEAGLSAPVQPGPRPKCPKCGDTYSLSLWPDWPSGLPRRVLCHSCKESYLIDTISDFAAFFPVAVPSADMEQLAQEIYEAIDVESAKLAMVQPFSTYIPPDKAVRDVMLAAILESLRRRVFRPEDVPLDVEGLQRALVKWLRRWELVDQEDANVSLHLAMDEVFDEKENADLLALLRRAPAQECQIKGCQNNIAEMRTCVEHMPGNFPPNGATTQGTPEPTHRCGLEGYGAPGDSCPACDKSRSKYAAASQKGEEGK